MKISIICPLYKGEEYIEKLHKNINAQENVDICSIKYILTESKDKSEEILRRLKCDYKKIKPEEFSHSKTREDEAMVAPGEILVFITQDIIIKNNLWLYNLVKHIEDGSCEAAFSKQICDNNSLEKYVREKNYEQQSRLVSKESISKLGFRTFFFSDASSAIKKDIFVKLNGYDNKIMPTNEDMYIAYKLITNGYRIRYCSESEVIHSHTFTLKQLYKRYYDTGIFLKQNDYLLKYKANKTGMGLLGYVLKRAIEEKNFKVLVNVIPNFTARYLGNFFGKRSVKNR